MVKMRATIRVIYTFWLDLLFPNKCVICGKFGSVCCSECFGSIEKIMTSTCPECGKISKNSDYCPACRRRVKASLQSIMIASSYHSPVVKELIHEFKYCGMTAISSVCGELIYSRIANIITVKDLVIVPVPLHKKRQNHRGFNQSELLARYLSKRLNISGGNALERVVNTKNQVTLSRKERFLNLEDAFVCVDREFIEGKNVLLIDDVMTTGATLNECAKILKKAGAKKVFGAVIARNI